MPVGKPTDDGEIVLGSRHSHAAGRTTVTVWNCPACGVKVEGRKVEQGCPHCGSGDPTKSQAGKPLELGHPTVVGPGYPGGDALQGTQRRRTSVSTTPLPASAPASLGRAEQAQHGMRVLRLIEYLIKPGKTADITLRRSLVGRMDMDWGTLTGTIVDSCDARQEDLLQLARRQPGVWASNSSAMEQAARQDRRRGGMVSERTRLIDLNGEPASAFPGSVKFNPFADAATERERNDRMDMPDTGPAFTSDDAQIAANIARLWGLKLTHTLALALSQIAPELEANMEPLKFLSAADCLSLANALMQEIPDDWDPQPEESEAPPQTIGDM